MVDEAVELATVAKEPRAIEAIKMARGGIAAARAGDYETGYNILGEVCDRLRKGGDKLPAPILSYYGLCLGMIKARYREAADFCQAAIEAEPLRPDHYANLVEVCMAARIRRRAVMAIERGLALDPQNQRLLALQQKLGTRRKPVVRALDRSHPLNVGLGRIRHALTGPPKPPRPKRGRREKDEG